MLSSVSWSEYTMAIIIILAIYYVLVGYRFYRHDLIALSAFSKQTQTFSITQFKGTVETADLKNTPTVESFADEIKAYLQEAANDQFERNTVVYGLCSIANKYAPLKTSEYRYALEELIKSETETYCAFALDRQELVKIWNSEQA